MRVRLTLGREQILGFRRRAGGLEQRAALTPDALRRAAWAGCCDSMPRAAVLSLHARINGIGAAILDHEGLAQVWGPRYSVYVVAADDIAPFTLGRLPDDARGRERAQRMAAALAGYLDGRRESYDHAGAAIGLPNANALRYGTATGTILIRWEGARAPQVWCTPAPDADPQQARRELARRYLTILGPGTAAGFGAWAGIRPAGAAATFAALTAAGELIPAATPLGERSILAADEQELRAQPGPGPHARLLPSGDAYYLLWGGDRELLLPEPGQQARLWTSRVWPGAVLVGSEIRGVWRRAGATVSVEPFGSFTVAERDAVEAEAAALPIQGARGSINVRWAALS